MKTLFFLFSLATAGLVGCSTSKPQKPVAAEDPVRGYFEVLRSDFNSQKVKTLTEVMNLTAGEADTFWPLYRNYEAELAPVSDRKLALLRDFLDHHKAGTLTDAKSKELAKQWLQNAQDRLDLWKKYHAQIAAKLSPMRAAQFLQVENQMTLFVDISIASEMPLVGTAPQAAK